MQEQGQGWRLIVGDLDQYVQGVDNATSTPIEDKNLAADLQTFAATSWELGVLDLYRIVAFCFIQVDVALGGAVVEELRKEGITSTFCDQALVRCTRSVLYYPIVTWSRYRGIGATSTSSHGTSVRCR